MHSTCIFSFYAHWHLTQGQVHRVHCKHFVTQTTCYSITQLQFIQVATNIYYQTNFMLVLQGRPSTVWLPWSCRLCWFKEVNYRTELTTFHLPCFCPHTQSTAIFPLFIYWCSVHTPWVHLWFLCQEQAHKIICVFWKKYSLKILFEEMKAAIQTNKD